MRRSRAASSLSEQTADELIAAFSGLDFEFEDIVAPDGGRGSRGFARNAIVEVAGGPASTVSLLVSTEAGTPSITSSAVCLATAASVLRIDFMGWLAGVMASRGQGEPWTASALCGGQRVIAEYLGSDAILVTFRWRAPN